VVNVLELTFDVVLSVRLAGLVIVNHCDYVQQVVLVQLLQAVGELFHVHVLVPPVLLLGRVLATDAVGIGGAGLLKEGEQLWLRIPEGLSSNCQ
jgi:hypothetical protein